MSTSIDSLPLDALVQILCKLSHDELKLLRSISKSFHDAALIAQRMHFNFSTPEPKRKTTFPGDISISAPGAPLLKLGHVRKPRTSKLWKQEIAVVLFPAKDQKKGGLLRAERWCHTANSKSKSKSKSKAFIINQKLHA